jgi:hypothetical protein
VAVKRTDKALGSGADGGGPEHATSPGEEASPIEQPESETSSKVVDLLSPGFIEMTIIAQDPLTVTAGKPARILTSKVKIPKETLAAGPRSHRFFVVDYDLSEGQAHRPAKLTYAKDKFKDRFDRKAISNATLKNSHAFHAQNVFAIATRTLRLFEYYLGRRVPWAFDSHELFLVPNAQLQGNAYYDHKAQAVLFGYVKSREGVVRTCLSHDIVAHEVTHAILDGLRPSYLQPGLPDQPALHEAFADLVALLSVFEIKDVLQNQFDWLTARTVDPDRKLMLRQGQLPRSAVEPESLDSTVLFAIAEQLGRVQLGERAIRYPQPLPDGSWWRDDPDYLKPHKRCQIVVAAVMRTLRDMWIKRLEPLIHSEADEPWLDLDRTVEEGAHAANYLLGMIIRALDYLPPVDVAFEDFLDAVLVADEVVSPDDPFHYRRALEDGFKAFGIRRPETRHIRYKKPDFTNLNFNALRHDEEEVYRFIWNNAKTLLINLDYPLYVNRVRTATRVGVDGLIVEEVVATYTQKLCITAEELPNVHAEIETSGLPSHLDIPSGLRRDAKVHLWGGGAMIFNQFGKPYLHQRKSLALDGHDIKRQQERLDYLVKKGYFDGDTSIGFLSDPGFALHHEYEDEELAEEMW